MQFPETTVFPVQTLRRSRSGPIDCPRCDERFDLVQPDRDDAERLLAICHGCDRWWLLVCSEGSKVYAAALPSSSDVRMGAT